MGRGRAKAKQTKVARRLKYHSPNTDLDALERELSGGESAEDEHDEDPYDGYEPEKDVDPYAGYGPEKDVDEPREEDWLPRKR